MASQVVVRTGMTTIEFAVPGPPQTSVTLSPTVTSTRMLPSTPDEQGTFGRLQGPEVSLVSPCSITVKSEPPSESISPTPQPVWSMWTE